MAAAPIPPMPPFDHGLGGSKQANHKPILPPMPANPCYHWDLSLSRTCHAHRYAGLVGHLRLIFHIYALRRGLIPRLGGGE